MKLHVTPKSLQAIYMYMYTIYIKVCFTSKFQYKIFSYPNEIESKFKLNPPPDACTQIQENSLPNVRPG